MDSRLHSQRHRSRTRGCRAFSPPQDHQFMQQLPPSAHYHASPLQQRLSLVEERFPALPSRPAISVDHCDYASVFAYRQRLDGLLSPHPAGMVSHLARNQNAVWSQAERPQGFRSADTRLAPSNEYSRQGFRSTDNRLLSSDDYSSRQGPFGRDYRDTRDDLQSLSELDSSRRSAALSAKLFLDDVRPGPSVFHRGTPFEPAPPADLNRHHFDREDMAQDSLLTKGSQRLTERGLRKREREEDVDMDRDRATRHRRFHDPGLAVLPRTPESSRDFPLVQRILSSGRFTEPEYRHDGHTISTHDPSPYEKQESLYIASSKSAKKKPIIQRRRASSSEMRHPLPDNTPPSSKRSDEFKEELVGRKDPVETFLRSREPHFREQSARDNKTSSPSPSTSHFKQDIEAGFVDTNRSNRSDHAKLFNVHKEFIAARLSTQGESSAARVSRQGTPGKEQGAGERNPKQRLAARSLTSIRKALKAVEATPRSKNLKSRVIRLLGSDAKVCGVSPKSRQGGPEVNREVVLELQTAKGIENCKGAMQQDTRSSQENERKETHRDVEIKQEQLVLTDVQGKGANQPLELTVSSHVQCQNSADCRNSTPNDNNVSSVDLHRRGLEKQQSLKKSEVLLPHSIQEEIGPLSLHSTSENAGWSTIGSAGITIQPSATLVPQLQAETLKKKSSIPSLLSLSVNIDAEDIAGRKVKDNMSAMLDSSLFLDSQLCKQSMPTPLDCRPASTSSYDSCGIQHTSSLHFSNADHVSQPSLFQTLNSSLPVSLMLKLPGDADVENRALLLEVQKLWPNIEVSTDKKETTAECEVRLFGKSLKAPVAKGTMGKVGSPTTPDLSLEKIQELAFSSSQVASEQLGTSTGFNEGLRGWVDVPAVSTPGVASKVLEATVGSKKKGEEANPVMPHHMMTSEEVSTRQGTKFTEAADNTLHDMAPETSFSLPVLASEQQVVSTESLNKVLESTFDSPPCIVGESAISTPVLASEQQGDIIRSQATSDTPLCTVAESSISVRVLASEQQGEGSQATADVSIDAMERVIGSDLVLEQQAYTVAREDLPLKDSVPREVLRHSESVPGHGAKPEAIFSGKPASHTPSKQVSVATLHPHGRLQNMPGRAGANTWRRSASNHGLSTSQATCKVPKPLVNKNLPKVVSQKVSEAAAYVRKGNSLVRAPISSITGVSSSSNVGVLGAGKDVVGKGFTNLSRAPRGYPGFKDAVKNTKSVFRQVFSFQKMVPNEATARFPSHDKILAAALTPEVSQDSQSPGFSRTVVRSTMAVTSEGQPNSAKAMGTDNLIAHSVVSEASNPELNEIVHPRPLLPCAQSGGAGPKTSEISSTIYVKSKANQLIAALPTKTTQAASSCSSAVTQGLYYKRNKNQLVRNGSESKKKSLPNPISRGETHSVWHSALRKALRKRAYLPSSRVWTLKHGSSSQVRSFLPLLFPWKRTGLGVAVCAGRLKALPKAKKGSLLFLISKRLQRLRKVQPVYSRSAGGFSLHRSGVLSLSGANLKWTKSIEKRSKQASEEATKAVAAVEIQRRKEKAAVAVAASAVAEAKACRRLGREASRGRERVVTIGLARYKMDTLGRTLQRLPDQWCGTAEASHLKQSTDLAILSTPRRLSFDGTEYVRIGNGHQLVRDPKAATRALANEKVRWSLHTARSRRAKRQQYCLFFTRFGKCNKSEGDCPYTHDPEKVAVCTKFLKGTCSGTNCLFSHKVIPERMPDCSFFLEGICTKEECPYRHVSVNPKAPICEGFLKGFCSNGDECNKKHTTVCPTFSATGECVDKSTCKLHHPKRKGKRAPHGNVSKFKPKKRRRYFGADSVKPDQCADGSRLDKGVPFFLNDSSCVEFIEIPEVLIDFDENDDFKRKFAFIKEHLLTLQDGFEREADMLIKPVLLLRRPVSAGGGNLLPADKHVIEL